MVEHDEIYRTPIDKEEFSFWEITPAEGLVQINIPLSWQLQADRLLLRKTVEKPDDGFTQLIEQLEAWR